MIPWQFLKYVALKENACDASVDNSINVSSWDTEQSVSACTPDKWALTACFYTQLPWIRFCKQTDSLLNFRTQCGKAVSTSEKMCHLQ